MQVVHERCCGVDVHKKTVVACLLTPGHKQLRTFGTMTADIQELVAWLQAAECTHVAMESTGVYWKPIYNLLEDRGMELVVANARHIKAVPGRKTDVKDAEWHPEGSRDLLRHGLLRGSHIPDRARREVQELVRYRTSLIEERTREVQRIQKVLEGANIKLSSVASNVVGVSGRAMLEAMIAGVSDPKELAGKAVGTLQRKQADLERALVGLVGDHQRLMLATQLRHIDFLDEEIARLDTEIETRLRPFDAAIANLDTIPGVGRRAAEAIIAAIGTDMSRFPTHRHLASWAKLCPGTRESGGKQHSERIGKGNAHLRTTLVEVAWAASRTRNTYLASQYHRLAARKGSRRALIAVAHTILIIIYHILKEGTAYHDLGPNHFDERAKEMTIKRAVERLERLGKKVTLEDAA